MVLAVDEIWVILCVLANFITFSGFEIYVLFTLLVGYKTVFRVGDLLSQKYWHTYTSAVVIYPLEPTCYNSHLLCFRNVRAVKYDGPFMFSNGCQNIVWDSGWFHS